MPQRSPNSAALDFLNEWEEGGAPCLKEYLASCTGDAADMIELVADCLIFEALANPIPQWVPPARP